MSLLQRPRLDGLKTKTVVWLTTGIGGFLAVGLAGLIAVAGTLPKQELPKLAIGSAIEAAPWRIVLRGASIGPNGPNGRPAGPGSKALVVELDMTNLTAGTRNDYADAVRLDPALKQVAGQPTTYLMRDRDILFGLHPDLTERVAISWTLPADTIIPDQLPVTVYAEQYKERDNLVGSSGWYNPHPVGVVALPVVATAQGENPT